MFPDPARIRAEAGLSGDVNMCRSQTISTLEVRFVIMAYETENNHLQQALLDPGLFLKPDRLLSIIDDAMQYQIGQCLFHNERTTTAYILKRHQCSCDNIPSYCAEASRICDVQIPSLTACSGCRGSHGRSVVCPVFS